MFSKTSFITRQSFEAARRLKPIDTAPHLGQLHGHSFLASLATNQALGTPAFAGDELRTTQQVLARALTSFDYCYLNDVLKQTPYDSTLGAWLYQAISDSNITTMAINSTAYQGIQLDYDEPNNGRITAWRRYRFEAAHQLTAVPANHKCGTMHGHGFEVAIYCTHSTIDSTSLLIEVCNEQLLYKKIDTAWQPIFERMHHSCLNTITELPSPTSECIAQWLWKQLKNELPQLARIQVYETPTSGVEFDGAVYYVWKDFTFDSATQLTNAPSSDKRSSIFGHTYQVQVKLCGPELTKEGWLWDFYDIKTAFAPMLISVDHQVIHKQKHLASGTAETIAHWMLKELTQDIPMLHSIALFETPMCGVVVTKTKKAQPT
jgi:6-pyruvoyltetrahydropterin/6-carboxytetrahydropterin synthase